MSRRRFLAVGGMSAAALMLGAGGKAQAQTASEYPSSLKNPFRLGVASGDPFYESGASGIVLWTRLAPDPLKGGGMPNSNVKVYWQVAKNGSFSESLKEGVATATPGLGHSVHVEVKGLEPATTYYYRFRVGKKVDGTYRFDSWNGYSGWDGRSRTKTLPAPGASVAGMTFAFVSCQKYHDGYYPAYRDIANQNLDCVVHLGDYIYEYKSRWVRETKTAVPTDLKGYRNRHAEYKTDPQLQAAHAVHPWVVTWDDHEVYQGYAGGVDVGARRNAAYQAYYEHMPLRPSSVLAQGGWANVPLYRQVWFGNLAQFCVLDTRQYRHDQIHCSGVSSELVDQYDSCYDERFDPNRSITGTDQEDRLKDALTSSGPLWNVVANQVPMFEFDNDYDDVQGDYPDPAYDSYYVEAWDGYGASRNRVLKHLADNRVSNPVVISGDMHCAWAADLKYNDAHPEDSFRRDDSTIIGTEFTGTSVSTTLSQGWKDTYRGALPSNEHVKYFDDRQGGYVLCTVNDRYWRSDFRLADSLNSSTSLVRTVASRYAWSGAPGVRDEPPTS